MPNPPINDIATYLFGGEDNSYCYHGADIPACRPSFEGGIYSWRLQVEDSDLQNGCKAVSFWEEESSGEHFVFASHSDFSHHRHIAFNFYPIWYELKYPLGWTFDDSFGDIIIGRAIDLVAIRDLNAKDLQLSIYQLFLIIDDAYLTNDHDNIFANLKGRKKLAVVWKQLWKIKLGYDHYVYLRDQEPWNVLEAKAALKVTQGYANALTNLMCKKSDQNSDPCVQLDAITAELSMLE